MTTWQLAAHASTPGWIEIPDIGQSDVPAWLDRAQSDVEQFWQGNWTADVALQVRVFLEHAQETRSPDDGLKLLYWPARQPAVVSIRVRATASIPLSLWLDAGYSADSYSAPLIGHGAELLKDAVYRDNGTDIRAITANYVFTSGDACVLVTVDPAPVEFVAHMTPSFHALMRTLEVTRPDGVRFKGVPVKELEHLDVDDWNIDDDGSV